MVTDIYRRILVFAAKAVKTRMFVLIAEQLLSRG